MIRLLRRVRKDKEKDKPGETGADVKGQNITISAQQFQRDAGYDKVSKSQFNLLM